MHSSYPPRTRCIFSRIMRLSAMTSVISEPVLPPAEDQVIEPVADVYLRAVGSIQTLQTLGSGLAFCLPPSDEIPEHLSMRLTLRLLVTTGTFLFAMAAQAAPLDFSGHWFLDLRTPAERQQKLECGSASFELTQTGDRILGSHSMATAGCGRLNEGGPETVKGVVVGEAAVLVVTSGRNGAIVMGTARLRSNTMHWQTLDEIRPGEPEGDSPLVLGQGHLTRMPK